MVIVASIKDTNETGRQNLLTNIKSFLFLKERAQDYVMGVVFYPISIEYPCNAKHVTHFEKYICRSVVH